MKQIKNVEVEWIDSIGSPGWGDYTGVDMTCKTVGMLLENNKDNIVIAMNQSAFGYGNYMTIPKKSVKRVKKLKA